MAHLKEAQGPHGLGALFVKDKPQTSSCRPIWQGVTLYRTEVPGIIVHRLFALNLTGVFHSFRTSHPPVGPRLNDGA